MVVENQLTKGLFVSPLIEPPESYGFVTVETIDFFGTAQTQLFLDAFETPFESQTSQEKTEIQVHHRLRKPGELGPQKRPVKERPPKGDPERTRSNELQALFQIFSCHEGPIALTVMDPEYCNLRLIFAETIGLDVQKESLFSKGFEKTPVMFAFQTRSQKEEIIVESKEGAQLFLKAAETPG